MSATIIQCLFAFSQWLFVLGFLGTFIYGSFLMYHVYHVKGYLALKTDADSWHDTLNASGIVIYSFIALASVFSMSCGIKLVPQFATNIFALVSFALVTHKLFLIATGHIYVSEPIKTKYQTIARWIFGTGLVIAFFAIVLSWLTVHPEVIRSYAKLHKILFCYFFAACVASLLELVLTPLNTTARIFMGLIVAVSGFGLVVSLPFNGAHEDISIQWDGKQSGLIVRDSKKAHESALDPVSFTKAAEAPAQSEDAQYAKSTFCSWIKTAWADLRNALNVASESLNGKFGNKLILLIASVCATITAVVAFTMTTILNIAGWNSLLLSSLYFIPYFLVMYWGYNKADERAKAERASTMSHASTPRASLQPARPSIASGPALPVQKDTPQP